MAVLQGLIGAGSLIIILAASIDPAKAAGDTVYLPSTERAYTLRLLDLRISSVCIERVARVLEGPNEALFATADTLTAWGLLIPTAQPLEHGGQQYYPLSSLPGVSYYIDESTQELVLETETASCFTGTEIRSNVTPFSSQPPLASGGFINYDILHQGGDISSTTNAALELGLFNRLGTGTSTLLARDTVTDSALVRLNTTWRYDWPVAMRTLILGDTLSHSGTWGRSVHYGGIQWGSNYTTRPDFITYPLPQISGETVVPAAIELYTNDLKRLQTSVQSGPFTLHDVPVVTGMNTIRVVVEDVLGREQIISQPFYASRSLLKQGLHDYTYEAGAIRRGYALSSNDYGRPFAAATHAFGFTNRITGEVRVEATETHQTLGTSLAWIPANWLGVISAAAATSASNTGKDSLLSAGIERKGRYWSYGLHSTWSGRNFRQLGLLENQPPPARTVAANLGIHPMNNVSLSLTYSQLRQHNDTDNRFVNAAVSTRLYNKLVLRIALLRDLEKQNSLWTLNFSYPLGNRTSTGLTHHREQSGYRNQLQIQRNTPRGSGFGYRISIDENSHARDRHHIGIIAQTNIGTYRAETARVGDEHSYRLNARGGFAILGGSVFASRRIDDSFGVVQVGDYANVRVYHENHLIADTSERGTAFIPELRSFQTNRIRIDAKDLPLDAHIEKLEKVVVPSYRQGAFINFDVASTKGALITVYSEDGDPLPAGSIIRLLGKEQTFPVARRGEAWITGLELENILESYWNGQRCTFKLRLPENAGPMPRIGPLTCKVAL